ncbi:GNAT family N-acetyltransferase [Microbacterium sp. M1A1_1b]
MAYSDAHEHDDGLVTDRLLLRRWRPEDASFHRRLWQERDPRVPARRRITPDGRPTIAELQDWARSHDPGPAPGLRVVERLAEPGPVGYCGLVANSVGQPDEPELAFEFLRSSWNQGFATEAATAVVDQARTVGYAHLAATVRAWNTASLRVLEKLGFTDTGQTEPDALHGDSILLRKVL